VDQLHAVGIERYEISNFAVPGYESRHNLQYWLRESYLGFGADAHSFQAEERWENVASATEYVERLERDESPVVSRTPADPAGEPFFLGLRLMSGIEATAAHAKGFTNEIAELVIDGLLEQVDGRIRLTRRGVLLSNEVFERFLPDAPVPASRT
jgi:oxygen-independent coproporphyrinogen-3 oxidase